MQVFVLKFLLFLCVFVVLVCSAVWRERTDGRLGFSFTMGVSGIDLGQA